MNRLGFQATGYVKVKSRTFKLAVDDFVASGCVAMNAIQRRDIQCSIQKQGDGTSLLGELVDVTPWFAPCGEHPVSRIHVEVDIIPKTKVR